MDGDLAALYRFVEARFLDTVWEAESRGDFLTSRFFWGSKRILEGLQGDLRDGSLAQEPAVGYLVRAADRYADHPELPALLRRR